MSWRRHGSPGGSVLHVEVTGRGEPLVLLHGWGMHGGVWQEAAEQLADAFQVCVVDLPGHGYSAGEGTPPFTLEALSAVLSARFAEPVSVLGWSLGGIIAQHWALCDPARVKRLILVASTPCFARRADWDHGMPQEILGQFAADLEHDFMATLRRFLALQVRGAEGERETLAALRARLFSRGEPDPAVLRQGLAILRDADLRGDLGRLAQPALVIAGDRDRLTPPQASRYLAQAMPRARLVELAGAAHAPFLSHRDAFLGALRDFMSV